MNTRIRSADTPRLLLDARKLGVNLERMKARAAQLGVTLRPHLKTAKSVDVARLATDPGKGRIAVSTLKEAEYFADAGYRNILYTVGITAARIGRAAALRRRAVELSLIIDNLVTVTAINEIARSEGVTFSVFIEVDTDGHRAGVKPSDPNLIHIGHALESSCNLRLAGVLAHAGSSYHCAGSAAIATVAEQERAGVVEAANRLRASGLAVPEVSVGSTPTVFLAQSIEGITEVRAGVYMFFDLFMVGLGVCRIEDIALSVLTTVIGHRPDRGWLIVDAGWMALSADRGTSRQGIDPGYGLVCTDYGSRLDGVSVLSVNQEHGIIGARPGAQHLDVAQFPLGTQLRILPNHACATASQHDSYLLVGSDGVTCQAQWPRLNGW